MQEKHLNWAGNYTYSAAQWHVPASIEELQEIVASSRKLRVVGTRHSFNSIADSPDTMVSLERFNRVVELDREHGTVTVEAGIRYGDLARYLHAEGYALHNMASLPHISVGGAVATATHGSGDKNGNLATAVVAIEFVAANGERVTLSRERDGEQFQGAVVHLGGLGAITQLTLRVEPTFEVKQNVYERLPLASLESHFDEVTSAAYSVSMFTDWQHDYVNQVWLKQRVGDGDAGRLELEQLGARPAPKDRHPIDGVASDNCTPQHDVPGPWHERLPHFRLEYTPSLGAELQSEYFVPREHALEGIQGIRKLRDQLGPLLLSSELRTIAADHLWMSGAYERSCVGFHFTWKQDWPRVKQLLPLIEQQLASFGARPHWGKLFTMSPANMPLLFERLSDFQRLLQQHDPEGKFRNPFLDSYVFGAS